MNRASVSTSSYQLSLKLLLSVLIALPLSALIGQSSDSTVVFNLITRATNDLQKGNSNLLAERLDSLEGIQDDLLRPEWKLSALCALTELHTSSGSLDEAQTFSELGLKHLHSEKENLPDTLTDLTYYLHALLQQERGDWDSFAIYMDSSFQILQSLDEADPIREARNSISMSYMTYNEGKLGKTVEWTKSGINKMLQVQHLSKSDSTQLASLYSNIGFLNNVAGRFDDVIPNYNFALQYDSTLVSPYINQAVILRSTQPKRSIELSKQVLQYILPTTYHNRCSAFSNIISSSLVLAESLEDTLHFNIALQYHDSILNMTQYARTRDYPFAANSHGLFSDYYSRVAKSRDIDKAWFHLQNNLKLLRDYYDDPSRVGLEYLLLTPKERLARLSTMKGDFKTADKSLKEVNKSYRGADYLEEDEFIITKEFLLSSTNTLTYPITYIANLISWSDEESDPTIKLLEADEIYKIVDSTFDDVLKKNELKIERLPIYRLHARGAAISIRMYEHTGISDYMDEAHDRIEKLFSLDIFSNLVRAKLKNSTDAASAIYKDKLLLREEIDLLNKQDSIETKDKTRLDSLNREYVQLSEKLGTSYKPENTEHQLSLDELRLRIDADEVILYYVHDKLSSSLYGLCITQDTVVSINKHVEDLESLVYQTNLSLANPKSTNYKDQLQQLHKIFIGSLSDIIEGKQITICSMGKLELVPYDLLMDKEENYLCFDQPIRHVYSAGWSKDPSSQKSSGIQGYTSSPNGGISMVETRKEEFGNLISAREEIEFLKKEFNAKVFINEKSTKEKFKNTAPDAAILHLALHGVVNPLEPIKSRLVFGLEGNDEEDLYFHEIDDLDINAQLVTLSACNSGLGNMHGAGSIASLARAFHYAGCPNVVQTSWPVNDETSLQLMKSFYTNLHEGKTIPTALSTAKRQFYNSVPQKWRHPYYWGGYVYNGEDISLQIDKKSMISQYALPGLMIIILLVITFCYKLLRGRSA